jgi:hypothetical protein
MRKCRKRNGLRHIYSNESGSVLIEASLTMPLILLSTLVFLAVGYSVYHRALLTQRVYEWTERAAYVWKDSHRDPITGSFSYLEMDDVYGTMISEGFGFLTAAFNGFRQAELQLPQRTVSGSRVPASKLLRSSGPSGDGLSGEAVYINRLLEGEIQAAWSKAHSGNRDNTSFFQQSGKRVQASAYYTDPVELLRTIELIQTYSAKLKSRFSSPGKAADELGGMLPEPASRPVIRSEKQAKAFLQRLIGGASRKVTTKYGIRHIDVLDTDGIMHEAKYTVNKTDARNQIKKDAELIRTSVVKGVVWHFFPLERTGQCDITPSLQKELENNGILVVLHR